MFPFFLLYGFNDCPDDFRSAGQPAFDPFTGGQAFRFSMGQRYQFFQIMKVFWVLIFCLYRIFGLPAGIFRLQFEAAKQRFVAGFRELCYFVKNSN